MINVPLWIVLTACLVGQPKNCLEVNLGQVDDGIMQCLVLSMPAAAKWLDKHPSYKIESINCQDEEPTEGEDL